MRLRRRPSRQVGSAERRNGWGSVDVEAGGQVAIIAVGEVIEAERDTGARLAGGESDRPEGRRRASCSAVLHDIDSVRSGGEVGEEVAAVTHA